ncbi:Hpt domain-containing protein [bacterium]|nr:Hpt domain-containing protein [bacterium]
MSSTPIDVQAGIARIGDAEIWKEIVHDYIEVVEGLICEIGSSIRNQDALKLRQDAHAIKGSSLELQAGGMADLAAELEMMGRESRLDGSQEKYGQIQEEFRSLINFLSTTEGISVSG